MPYYAQFLSNIIIVLIYICAVPIVIRSFKDLFCEIIRLLKELG